MQVKIRKKKKANFSFLVLNVIVFLDMDFFLSNLHPLFSY